MKKIWLAIFITVILMNSGAFADATTILDCLGGIETGCKGERCSGTSATTSKVTEGSYSAEVNRIAANYLNGYVPCSCSQNSDTFTVSNLKIGYEVKRIDSFNPAFTNEEVACDCGKKESYIKNAITKSGEYEKVIIAGEEWYLHKDFVPEGNTRVLYREASGSIELIQFDKTQIDMYDDEEITGDDIANGGTGGYKVNSMAVADPIYENGRNCKSGQTPNTGATISRYFFICKTCIECANCGQNVAMGAGYFSRYCEDCTCLFTWAVENGAGSVEGLKCTDAKNGNFCDKHKCRRCENPIIGVNMATILESPKRYQGSELMLYSYGCEKDCCLKEYCLELNGGGTGTSDTGSDKDAEGKDRIYVKQPTHYCDKHDCSCAVCGGKHVVTIEAFRDAGERMICADCKGKYVESISAEKEITLKANALKECATPGCENKFIDDGNDYCIRCRLEKNGSPEEKMEIVSEMHKSVYENVKDLTSEQQEVMRERFEEYADQIGINSDEMQKIINEDITELGLCTNCYSLLAKTEDGKTTYCPNCASGQEAKDDTSDSNTSNGGNKVNSYSGTDFSWSSNMGGSTSLGTVDQSTCQHNNYPVPNTVTFSNVTDTTHLQAWNCSNCQTSLTETYQHTFINGACVCGFKESDKTTSTENSNGNLNSDDNLTGDDESPIVNEITPSAGKINGGEKVILSVGDNEGLAEIEYLCFWGEKRVETKTISGKEAKVELGILPSEAGEYYVFVNYVKDTTGNITKVKDPYIFTVGDVSDILNGKHVDTSFDDYDSNSIIYIDYSSSPKPI